jgi:hypothetical protein
MALSNRFSGLERRDFRFTDKQFHIYSTKTCVRKLLLKFDGDQTVGSKVRVLTNRYCGLDRRDLHLTEPRFHVYSKENGVQKLFYNFEGDPRSDQKLGPFRTGSLVWSDETYASPTSDSTSTPRKPASGTPVKI